MWHRDAPYGVWVHYNPIPLPVNKKVPGAGEGAKATLLLRIRLR